MTTTTTKKRGLGRGLANLLSELPPPAANAAAETVAQPPKPTDTLTIEQLQRGKYQPRKEINPEALQELADSIKAHGIIQPIVVRKISAEHFEIIAGERRWRAAQLAGLTTVPVIVRDVSDEQAMAFALIENIQRENLNPLEEAHAYQRLYQDFKFTHEQIAKSVGKNRATITNYLRLLNLNEDVQALLLKDNIDMGHAKALLAVSGSMQSEIAQQIAIKGLSVRETEYLIQQYHHAPNVIEKAAPIDPAVQDIQTRITQLIGKKVLLRHQNSGKGKLIIPYKSLLELEKIMDHIK